MSLSSRILIVGIIGLIVVNTALAWTLWRVRSASTTVSATPVATAITIAATTRSADANVTTACRIALDSYIDLSNQRVYDYFDIYNSINKIDTATLVARIDILSKQVDPLPEGCPDNFQAAIHANYVSVYMTAPIHLHMIVTRTNADGSMTGVAKQALRMFEREIDIAERTNYELLRLAQ
ncbi:MAG: hypothetical protein ACK5GU_06360 [Chloroflexota bacterium]|jgi:hypothetical protein